jgi:outer membrane biosynthesis protein TonB
MSVEQLNHRHETLLRALSHGKAARVASLRRKSKKDREVNANKLKHVEGGIDAVQAAWASAKDAPEASVVLVGGVELPRAVVKVVVDREKRAARYLVEAALCETVDVEAWRQRVIDANGKLSDAPPIGDGEKLIESITTVRAALGSYQKWRRFLEVGEENVVEDAQKADKKKKTKKNKKNKAEKKDDEVKKDKVDEMKEDKVDEVKKDKVDEVKKVIAAPVAVVAPVATEEKNKKKKEKKEKKKEKKENEDKVAVPVYASRAKKTRRDVIASNGFASQKISMTSLFMDSLAGAGGGGKKRSVTSVGGGGGVAKKARPDNAADGRKQLVRPWERKVDPKTAPKPTKTVFGE